MVSFQVCPRVEGRVSPKTLNCPRIADIRSKSQSVVFLGKIFKCCFIYLIYYDLPGFLAIFSSLGELNGKVPQSDADEAGQRSGGTIELVLIFANLGG